MRQLTSCHLDAPGAGRRGLDADVTRSFQSGPGGTRVSGIDHPSLWIGQVQVHAAARPVQSQFKGLHALMYGQHRDQLGLAFADGAGEAADGIAPGKVIGAQGLVFQFERCHGKGVLAAGGRGQRGQKRLVYIAALAETTPPGSYRGWPLPYLLEQEEVLP